MKSFAIRLMLALMVGCSTGASADPLASAASSTDERIPALALEWLGRMKTGQIDRAQLSPGYNAQLTSEAVQALSQYLRSHDYGTAPAKAQITEQRTDGDQTFYLVRLTFPRGDAGSMLLGMNTSGQITGIMILALPGD